MDNVTEMQMKLWDRWFAFFTEHKDARKKRKQEIEEEMKRIIKEPHDGFDSAGKHTSNWPTIPSILFTEGNSTGEPQDEVEMQKKRLRDRFYGLYEEEIVACYFMENSKSSDDTTPYQFSSSAGMRWQRINDEMDRIIEEHGTWPATLTMEDLAVTGKTEREKRLIRKDYLRRYSKNICFEKLILKHGIEKMEIESERSSAQERVDEINKKMAEITLYLYQ